MFEEVFLICIGLIWIVFATVQDLKKREIANWLNFSLIIFALGFRFFYCLFSEMNFGFFYQGLIGLGIFFILGNLLYYGRVFAGGDAKLFMALGAVLPFSKSLFANLNVFVLFFFAFLIIGALYGLTWSLFLGIKNSKEFKKEFSKRFKKNKKFIYFLMIAGLFFMALGFFESFIFYFGVLIFVTPYFYFSAKAIDEACMIKKIPVRNLTEGDWLYQDLKIGKKVIKAGWDGLNKRDIVFIRKHKKQILIRTGIPFSPVFLISFILLIIFWLKGLWYSFW